MEIADKDPSKACFVAWFGDLGIIDGSWPLISTQRPFQREEWPVPRFGDPYATNTSKAWLSEYDQNTHGFSLPIRRYLVPIEEIATLPRDGVFMAGAVEQELTCLLSETNSEVPPPDLAQ